MKIFLTIPLLLLEVSTVKAETAAAGIYWFGFTSGAASTVCALANKGIIEDKDARNYMVGIFNGLSQHKMHKRYENEMLKAFKEVQATESCKNVFK